MFLFAILLLSSFACNAQIDYGLYVRHQQLGEYDAQYQFFIMMGCSLIARICTIT